MAYLYGLSVYRNCVATYTLIRSTKFLGMHSGLKLSIFCLLLLNHACNKIGNKYLGVSTNDKTTCHAYSIADISTDIQVTFSQSHC